MIRLIKISFFSIILGLSSNICCQTYYCDMFGQSNEQLTPDIPVTGKFSKTFMKNPGSNDNFYLVNADAYWNKWSIIGTLFNSVFTLNWGGGNYAGPDGTFATPASDNKFYTLQIDNASYNK